MYGNVAPVTVQNLVAAVQAGAFNGTAFSKISPGEFIQLGKQGSRRLGDVEPPIGKLLVVFERCRQVRGEWQLGKQGGRRLGNIEPPIGKLSIVWETGRQLKGGGESAGQAGQQAPGQCGATNR